MAVFFENVQWKVSVADVQSTGRNILGATLPRLMTQLTLEELTGVLKTLAVGKAAGCDDIPPEFWKVLQGSESAMGELLRLW